MIEINLIPGGGKKKFRAGASRTSDRAPRATAVDLGAMVAGVSERMRDRFLIGVAAVLVVSVSTVALLHLRQTERSQVLSERRDVAVADSTRYANILKERHR